MPKAVSAVVWQDTHFQKLQALLAYFILKYKIYTKYHKKELRRKQTRGCKLVKLSSVTGLCWCFQQFVDGVCRSVGTGAHWSSCHRSWCENKWSVLPRAKTSARYQSYQILSGAFPLSSCSSLGWPHLYWGGKNSRWHNAWLSEWCNLTPATRCTAVNTAVM